MILREFFLSSQLCTLQDPISPLRFLIDLNEVTLTVLKAETLSDSVIIKELGMVYQ